MEQVSLVRWPAEDERREFLRSAGTPRLLLVEPDVGAPATLDPLEDWVRLPADEAEVGARLATLAARAGPTRPAPDVDDDGLLRHRDRWVALSPVEQALVAVLIERFGAVVSRDTLSRRAWPDGSPTRNAARRPHPPAAAPHRASASRSVPGARPRRPAPEPRGPPTQLSRPAGAQRRATLTRCGSASTPEGRSPTSSPRPARS